MCFLLLIVKQRYMFFYLKNILVSSSALSFNLWYFSFSCSLETTLLCLSIASRSTSAFFWTFWTIQNDTISYFESISTYSIDMSVMLLWAKSLRLIAVENWLWIASVNFTQSMSPSAGATWKHNLYKAARRPINQSTYFFFFSLFLFLST